MGARDEHAEIEVLIPWHVNGSLGADERLRVERHAAACGACRALLEEATKLSGLTESDFDGLLDHVHARHLEAYARHPESLTEELSVFVREHLDECDVCREALVPLRRSIELSDGDVVRAAAGDRPVEIASVTSFRPWRVLRRTVLHPAAAAVYLVAALAMASLWLSATGPLDRGGPARRGGGGGVIDLVVVSGQVRGDDAAARLRLKPGDERVALGLDVELDEALDPAAELRVEIGTEDGRRFWISRVPVERARTSLVETGIVAVLVPRDALERGRLRVRVTERRQDAGSDPLLEAWLDVE